LAAAVAATTLVHPFAAAAGFAPDARCEAGKNDAVGKYAACSARAHRNLVLTGDVDRYGDEILKCQAKCADVFAKLEIVAGPGVCPSEADTGDVQDFVSSCVSLVSDALAGGTLPEDASACCSELGTCQDDLTLCGGEYDACQTELAACQTGAPNGLLESGQTGCWNSSGTMIDCGGSGQDGELLRGSTRSYAASGDGTITDDKTWLVWEKLSDDGSIHDKDTTYNWDGAFAKIATLNATAFAGYSDWRLPNVLELESLLDFERVAPTVDAAFHSGCSASCSVTGCSCTRSAGYWTSTTYLFDPPCAWVISFGSGGRSTPLKTSMNAARAVRGGN
jgi:hypothetical protein